MKPFHLSFDEHRRRLDLTYEELAGRLGYKAHSYVSAVCTGVKTLPLESVEQWVLSLKAGQDVADELYTSAIWSLAPDFIKRAIAARDERIRTIETRIEEIERKIVDRFLAQPDPPHPPL